LHDHDSATYDHPFGVDKFCPPASPKRSAYDEYRHKQTFLYLSDNQVAIVVLLTNSMLSIKPAIWYNKEKANGVMWL
jgi:hypothetical protein